MSRPKQVEQPDEQSFEQLYRQLEETVRRLDSGELALAEALASYEQGIQLAAACQQLLDRAELRIQRLSGVIDGAPTLEPFED